MVLKHSAKVYPDSPSINAGNLGSYNVRNSIWWWWYEGHGTPYQGQLMPIYEAHCCLLSAIAVPFYYASTIFSVPPIPVVGILVNSLLLTLTSVVIFCFSLELYRSKRISFILSLVFSVCSFAWPYNTTFWPHPLAALLFIASAYFIYISPKERKLENSNPTNRRRLCFAGLGGLFLGLSISAYPPSIVVIPGFVLYAIFLMKHDKRNLGIFLITFSIIILLNGVINFWRFGSVTNFGYGKFSDLNHGWEGLAGLLVSPGYGLIFFFPIVLLLPFAFKFTYKQNKPLFFLIIYLLITNLLYFGTLSLPNGSPAAWSGGWWGPRYLIAILPFITIVLGTLLQRSNGTLLLKVSLIILCIAGFYVNLLGKLVWPFFAQRYGWAVDELNKYDQSPSHPYIQALGLNKINSDGLRTWVPSYSLIILSMKALMSNYVTNETVNPNDGSWGTDTLLNCPYDVYIYCKFGIGPVLLLSAIAVIVATVVIMDRPKSLILYFRNVNFR